MTEESPVQPPTRDGIPRDDVEALIEHWREYGDELLDGGREDMVRGEERRECAGELEALLQE